MKLDRYNNKRPRFLVYRRMEEGENFPADGIPVLGPDGWLYKPVDSEDCFVLKRQDVCATGGLDGYASKAAAEGDFELSNEITRLRSEWLETPNRKMPD